MVTLSNAEKALKTFYLDVVTDQLNTKINPFLAKMEKTASNVYGNEIRKRVSYALNGGISACDEGGDLPIAAAPNYQEFVAKLKNLYGTLEISDKAIRATENNSGAFVSLLEAEVESLLTAAKFHFGRMLMGLETGVLAKVVSFTGNYITVDSVRNFMEGMIIDVIDDGTNVKKLSSRRITEVDRTNTRIKIDGSALGTGAIAEDNCVVMQGSYCRELIGLGSIFGTSTSLYGLSRVANKWISPYKTTSGEISDVIIQKAMDGISDTAMTDVDLLICSPGVRRAYQDYLITNKANVDYVDLNGYKAISVGGTPLVADRFCNEGRLYLLNTKHFVLHQLCDWRWLEGDDGSVLKQMPGKAAYTATLVKYAEMLCSRPNAQGCIDGITEA